MSDKKTALRAKCNVYAQLPTHKDFTTAKATPGYCDAALLARIESDIKNERDRKREDGYVVTPTDAYHWRRNLLLAEAGADYLVYINAPVYESEPYKSIVCRAAVVAIPAVVDSLSVEQIAAHEQFPRLRTWLAKQLATKQIDQVMCAKCKAADRGKCHRLVKCNCRQGCTCYSWRDQTSMAMLDRVEHSLGKKQLMREKKRRRTDNNIQHAA